MPRELVRNLVLKLIPAEDLAPVGEGTTIIPLEDSIGEYDDTAIVAPIFKQGAPG